MNIKRRFILVDLDDTVSGSWRREHLIQDSWDAFHSDLENDEPIFDMVRLLQGITLEQDMSEDAMNTALVVIALTARPEKWRPATLAWLCKHGVPVNEVLMRPDNDFRPSPAVKVAMAAKRFGGEDAIKSHVALIIDDHEGVIKAFAGLGVTALQIYARRDR